MIITPDGKIGIFIENIKDSSDKQVVIINKKTKEKGKPIKIKDNLYKIHIIPNNEYALLTSHDDKKNISTVNFVDIKQNKIVGEPIEFKNGSLSITSTLDGKYAFAIHEGEGLCDIIDIENQEIIGSLDQVDKINSIHMVPHSKIAIVVSYYNSELSKLDIMNIKDIKTVGNTIRVGDRETIVSADGKQLFRIDYHRASLCIVDIDKWECIEKSLKIVEHSDSIFCIDNEFILTSNHFNEGNIVNVKNQEVLEEISLYSSPNANSFDEYIKAQKGKFSLILINKGLEKNKMGIFDIKKKKLVGKPIKFLNSKQFLYPEWNAIDRHLIFVVPEDEEIESLEKEKVF
jgi:hypothetical protein